MFGPGDIVHFYSVLSGKPKYHLCLCLNSKDGKNYFLHVNSERGYNGDYSVEDGIIPGLPKSRTGFSVVSFSQLIRLDQDRLTLHRAELKGKIGVDLAAELLTFASITKVLSKPDREIVVRALEEMAT